MVHSPNRGQLLDLLRGFDLDAALTSDHEWCTYAELDGIAIHQLLTDEVDTDGTSINSWMREAIEREVFRRRPVRAFVPRR